MDYTQMSNEQLADFCTQKQTEIASAEKDLDKAKKELFSRLKTEKIEEIATPFGRYYQTYRTTYLMPEDIVAKQNELAALVELAKAEGRVQEQKAYFYKFGSPKKGTDF